MTYPPHPRQPGQQPYGHGPGTGGYPAAGNFPHQGQPYGPTYSYPGQGQYPTGSGPYGYPSGGPPAGHGPQPPKKKPGFWIGIIAIVGAAVVGIFAITAFAAPGFLLSDDDDDNTDGGSSTTDENSQSDESESPDGTGSETPEEFAEQVITSISNRDPVALEHLSCAEANENVDFVINNAENLEEIEAVGQLEEYDDGVIVPVRPTNSPPAETGGLLFAPQGSGWCWHDLGPLSEESGEGTDGSDGGAEEEPNPGDAEEDVDSDEAITMAESFLDAVNNGDMAAMDMICDDASPGTPDSTEKATEGSSEITIDPDSDGALGSSQYGYGTGLLGTVDGDEIQESNLKIASDSSEEGLCVGSFMYLSTVPPGF